MSLLRSQLCQVSRQPPGLTEMLWNTSVPFGIMHNPIFKGHPIRHENKGTERELMVRAVLYNVALAQL